MNHPKSKLVIVFGSEHVFRQMYNTLEELVATRGQITRYDPRTWVDRVHGGTDVTHIFLPFWYMSYSKEERQNIMACFSSLMRYAGPIPLEYK